VPSIPTLSDVDHALRESEERYRLAARATSDAIWDWDMAGDTIQWNDAAAERFGHDIAVTSTEWWRDHIHPDDRLRVSGTLHDVLRDGGDQWSAEYRFLHADATWAYVHDRAYVLRDEDGQPRRMIGAMIDLTEWRRAEEEAAAAHRATENERRRLRAVLDALPVGVFIANADGDLVEVNERARQIWGPPPRVQSIDEYVAYRGWWHDTGVPLESHDWAMARALTRGEVSIDEVIDIERFDGRRATIINNAAPIRDADGTIIGGIVAELDITEQKRIEHELLLAKEQAEEASRAKDDFLATVSHELRTPLTAILGWARMIRMPDLDPATRDEALETIERNAKAQAQLIDDILDVSRIVSGKLRIDVSTVDLREIAETALATLRPAASAKRIALTTDLPSKPVTVKGDASRLQQVVWNILANAIKFTPDGGNVELTLVERDRQACIRVRDTGDGIDAHFLPHVFDRFRQADNGTSRRHGGLGLGLAIVRHLVELHGGTVRAESGGVGHGATFEVRLPAAREIDVRPYMRPRGPADLRAVRVLVVDDAPDARRVIAAELERTGAIVTSAESASHAIALLQEQAHDILISDIGMPGRDGYELLRTLRANGVDIPAIALTAYARDEDRERALEAGFQAFVAKPVEAYDLTDAIARYRR
jgi:PAS domain S-box-containing protein